MQSLKQEQQRQVRRCRGTLTVRFGRLKPQEARAVLEEILAPHPVVAAIIQLETETDEAGRTIARVTVEVNATSPDTARLFALAPLSTGDPRAVDVITADATGFEACA